MSLPKMKEVKDLGDQELSDRILEVKRQLFELRMQKATRQLEKSHQFKHARHRLAQLMTIERERQRSAESSNTPELVAVSVAEQEE